MATTVLTAFSSLHKLILSHGDFVVASLSLSLSAALVAKFHQTLVTPLMALLSVVFSRKEYWSGLPFPSPGDLTDPGIEPGCLALQADSLQTEL